MAKRLKLSGEARKKLILEAAITFATREGWQYLTRDLIAVEAGCSTGLVSFYWSTPKLRKAVMRQGVRRGILEIIADGLAFNDADALKAPQHLQEQAQEWTTSQ